MPNDNDARPVPVPASLRRSEPAEQPAGPGVARNVYFVRKDNDLLEARQTNVRAPGGIEELIDALVNSEAGAAYRTAVPRSTKFIAATPNGASVRIELGIPALSNIGDREQRSLFQQIVLTVVDNTPYDEGVIFVVNNQFPKQIPGVRNPVAAGQPVRKLDYEPNTIFTTTTTTSTTTAPPATVPATSATPPTSAVPASSAPPASAPPPSATR